MLTLTRCALPWFAVLAGLSCSIFDPSFPAPATIIFVGDTAEISVPTSATRNTTFLVSVTTFGGGCTRTLARTEQRIVNGVLEIHPYNETRRAEACTDDLLLLTHTASLQVSTPGSFPIRIIGQEGASLAGGHGNRTVTLERVVRVD